MARSIIDDGTPVAGRYHGAAYRGVVVSSRPNYADYRITKYSVRLDSPITVYGETRDRLLIDNPDRYSSIHSI